MGIKKPFFTTAAALMMLGHGTVDAQDQGWYMGVGIGQSNAPKRKLVMIRNFFLLLAAATTRIRVRTRSCSAATSSTNMERPKLATSTSASSRFSQTGTSVARPLPPVEAPSQEDSASTLLELGRLPRISVWWAGLASSAGL